MRPVNLLPAKSRPRGPSGGLQGSSYIVLGVLGVLLVAVVAYVLTVNSTNSKKDQTAKAKTETESAEARSRALGPYAEFARIKEARLASVRDLAATRVDFERMVREIAHVLPDDVWVKETEASALPSEQQGQDKLPTSAGAEGGPRLTLKGCAKNQDQVATMMVRLRGMYRAADVQLVESSRAEGGGGEGQGGGEAAGGGDVAPSGDSCGSSGDKSNYKFEVIVAFTATPPAVHEDGSQDAPASLGGGQ
jgi:Tfp pilus assembly protein PilN